MSKKIVRIMEAFQTVDDRISKLELANRFLQEKLDNLLRSSEDLEAKNSIINYLISTDFKGTIKHKRLVSRFKKEIKEALDSNSFEEIRREILSGNRSLDDLKTYQSILSKGEEDQKIIDYCKEEEK